MMADAGPGGLGGGDGAGQADLAGGIGVELARTPRLRVAVDIGGTFTDLAALDTAGGRMWFAKASSTPEDLTRGIADCLAQLQAPVESMEMFVHGTTVVINAVLERDGAKTALVTTEGFRDVLEIARGNRPESFNILFTRHEPMVPRDLRLEAAERMGPDGQPIRPLDEAQLQSVFGELREQGVEAVAICFLHAYRNPAHERRAGELAAGFADWFVTTSHELSREYREYERTSTTVINAFVGPKVSRYVAALERLLMERGFRGKFFLMESNGGIASAETVRRQPILLMESGPVGGIAGAVKLGQKLRRLDLVTFDMGGTTAKASLVQGSTVSFDSIYYAGGYAHGYPVQTAVVDVVEVGAGGGSIAWIDDVGALRVGPRSAGAVPGPAAYGLGNEQPTVTDANLILGRLEASRFLGGRMRIDPALAELALAGLGRRLGYDARQMAAGIIRLANLVMSDALRRVSIERGKDPRDFALVAYGGNGPLHAAELAAELGMQRILVPRMPAHFSALGMLLADARYDATQTFPVDVGTDDGYAAELRAALERLERELTETITRAVGPQQALRFEHYAEMRYRGQDHTVKVSLGTDLAPVALRQRFEETYRERYGHVSPIAAQIVSLRVNCQAPMGAELGADGPELAAGPEALPEREVFSTAAERFVRHAAYRRDALPAGWRAAGPCLIEEEAATTLVPEGWAAGVLPDRTIELTRS